MHPQGHVHHLSSLAQHRHSDERHHQSGAHYIDTSLTSSTASTGPSLSSPSYHMPPKMEESLQSPLVIPRKKGGRGPGKRDSKEKPTISVRWEEADLTDRLVTALETHDRWSGVFTQTASAEHSRTLIGVPKRDLQREIARYLFRNDKRYDLDDKRTVEALAVSVKNKLFKIQTVFIECKNEFGQAANSLRDENDISPDSELAQTWARVKEKLPQFFRIRDIMSRPVAPIQPSAEPSSSLTQLSPTHDGHHIGSGAEGSFRTSLMRTSSSQGTFSLDPTAALSYDPSMLSPLPSGSNTTLPRPAYSHETSSLYFPPPRYFQSSMAPPPPTSRSTFITAYSTDPAEPGGVGHHEHEHDQLSPPSHLMNLRGLPSISSSGNMGTHTFDPRFSSDHPTPPTHSIDRNPDLDHSPHLSPISSTSSPPHSPNNTRTLHRHITAPSPPLATQDVVNILSGFDSRKRAHEESFIALKRMKIDARERDEARKERDKERWHERELLRLKIKLAQLKRGLEVDEEAADDHPGAELSLPPHAQLLGAGNGFVTSSVDDSGPSASTPVSGSTSMGMGAIQHNPYQHHGMLSGGGGTTSSSMMSNLREGGGATSSSGAGSSGTR